MALACLIHKLIWVYQVADLCDVLKCCIKGLRFEVYYWKKGKSNYKKHQFGEETENSNQKALTGKIKVQLTICSKSSIKKSISFPVDWGMQSLLVVPILHQLKRNQQQTDTKLWWQFFFLYSQFIFAIINNCYYSTPLCSVQCASF